VDAGYGGPRRPLVMEGDGLRPLVSVR